MSRHLVLSPLLKYSVAIGMVMVAALLRGLLPGVLGQMPYLAFFPAVAAAAMLGGLGPGLLATVLAFLSVDLLFDERPWHLDLAEPGNLMRLAFFLAGGLVVSVLAQQLRSALAARERLAAIVDSSEDAILSRDTDGIIRSWNAGAERLFGYTAQEIIGRPITQLLPPDRQREEERLMAALRSGKHIEHLETMRLAKGGRTIEVSVTVSPLKDNRGAIVGASKIIRDITERKEVETRLRLQAGALEAAANGIALTDASGTVLWANQAFAAMTGYSVAEIVGQNPRMLKSGLQPGAFYRDMWETIRRGEPWQGELINRRKDGSLYHEEQTITPLRDETGQVSHFIAIKQDVSLRKAKEAELAAAQVSAERAKAAAEEANKAKDHFLAVLSHELRTPLTAVLPAVDMLEALPAETGEKKELLEMVRRNVELEARLIDDLLDLTRIARGKTELNRRCVPLDDILRHAVEVCMPDIESRQLHFGMHIEDGPHFIEADAVRLQQVFWNLLKNAVKFTPPQGCVGVRVYRQNGSVVAEFTDSGVGIEPQALSRIFNAFEQADRGITRQFGGLGLGLAISKALVDLHGGSIAAHSEGKGKGACFTVRLPRVTCADSSRPVPAASMPAAAAEKPQRRLRILLVEDHGDTARILQRLLQQAGNQVQHAGDLVTALRLAGEQPFDLILSDLGLPDGSGVDLMRQLRARGNVTPAIALSGYGQEEDIRRSREAGFAMHLVKPTSPQRLAEAIASVQA